MKSGRSDRDFVVSVLARAGRLRPESEPEAGELVELAEAYMRLEERLGKIIAIGDKYQAEALEFSGRLRDALERLARLEEQGVHASGKKFGKTAASAAMSAKSSDHRANDPLLLRIRKAAEGGGEGNTAVDAGLLLRRYEKLDARLEKIVRISDGYQDQLREASLRMEFMARTDTLTGLPNRRDMVERFDREILRLDRYGTTFSLVLFDLDDFKDVNDCHGHNFGDEALRIVAYVFGRELRRTDVCGRWGGEEFLVLCPETGPAEAFLVGEKCRRAIGASAMESREGEVHITMSGGVCGAEKGLTMDDLVKRADDALYRAKAAGKDNIVSWPVS
ncbi:MAG: diguanylate cyclase [Rectinemataceae bacterium]